MTAKSSRRAKCKNLVAAGGSSSSSQYGRGGGGICAKYNQVSFLEK